MALPRPEQKTTMPENLVLSWDRICRQLRAEVGEDVYEAFVEEDARLAMYFALDRSRGRWRADLPSIARHKLFYARVSQIECCGHCTYGDADRFFSYRRQAETGRQATVAWLSSNRSDLP